jgi:hypothetical protein
MKNTFTQSAIKTDNRNGSTAMGARSNKSTLNSCVDLFGSIGSMRGRSNGEVISAFSKAFDEDPLTSLKILFWARDIRGGAGERKVSRTIFTYLATEYTEVMRKNLHLIHEYGRWDDYYSFEKTPLWDDVVTLMCKQLLKDMGSERPSLLGKWMKSNNTSSAESRRIAKIFIDNLGWSEKLYRKTLKALREQINIVEKKMCDNEWNDIKYQNVPSRAAMIYRKAFEKHDPKGYSKYLSDVENGKAEIKTSTLYPYDIVRNTMESGSYFSTKPYNKTLALQWDNLPDYVDPFNGLVVVDTSGSMNDVSFHSDRGSKTSAPRPIDVALSLAIYIAERNTSEWKNVFIPFSNSASFEQLKGKNIFDKVRNIRKNYYYGSTNLQSVFNLILKTAEDSNVKAEDMPQKLFIISDMQFDKACDSNKRTNFEQMKKKYKKAGYEMPDVIFWNVNAYGGDTPITVSDSGTALVSGASPAILKSVLSGEVITPLDVMNQTINTERYQGIVV